MDTPFDRAEILIDDLKQIAQRRGINIRDNPGVTFNNQEVYRCSHDVGLWTLDELKKLLLN